MKISRKMKEYLPLPIPLDKPFCELNEREAREYFDWFLAHIDERADYLREKVSAGLGIPIERLDFSVESAKPIWRWFLSVAELSYTPKSMLKRIEGAPEGQPRSFIDHFLEQSQRELSLFTEYVLRDVGMYVAKMFVSHHKTLYWTQKHTPKNYVSVNEPLIMGFIDDNPSYPKPFSPALEPIDFARTPAMRLFSNTQNENDLYDLCKKWEALIPEN
jgi:hypothetical protein